MKTIKQKLTKLKNDITKELGEPNNGIISEKGIQLINRFEELIKVVQPERLSEEDTKKERNIIDRYFETD